MAARTCRTASRTGGLAALAATLLLAAPAPAPAQDPVPVLLGALERVRRELPPGRATVDPSLLCTARLAGWSCPEPVAEALRRLELSPRGRDYTYVCLQGERACQLLATESLVWLERPEIRGRRATVRVELWWRTGRREQPVGHRRVTVGLVREGSRWRATRMAPGG